MRVEGGGVRLRVEGQVEGGGTGLRKVRMRVKVNNIRLVKGKG